MPKSRKRKNRGVRSVREGGDRSETTVSFIAFYDVDGNVTDVVPHSEWEGGVKDMPADVKADRERFGVGHHHLGTL